MYGDKNQTLGIAGIPSSGGLGVAHRYSDAENAASAPSAGVSSALNSLEQAICENQNICENIRSALGISAPKQTGEAIGRDGMAAAILRLASIVRGANEDLIQAVAYLNS